MAADNAHQGLVAGTQRKLVRQAGHAMGDNAIQDRWSECTTRRADTSPAGGQHEPHTAEQIPELVRQALANDRP